MASFARQNHSPNTNLTHAFHNQPHVTTNAPNVYVDTGVTTHMTTSTSHLDPASTYTVNDQFAFGNGHISHISHIRTLALSKDIKLSDVIIVPNITKNLLSISKLTMDSLMDVLFSNPLFPFRTVS